MKMKLFLSLILILFTIELPAQQQITNDPVPGSCTIFSAAIGDKVFFGNNEDYYKPKTYLWTDPATKENYGCIYVGFKDYSHQGGINEKGLCFDANALPGSQLNPHEELLPPPVYDPPYQDYMIWAPVLMLRKAATVEEVIELAGKYQRKNWYPKSGGLKYQLNFADATGDAVIISVDETGELAFTRKSKGENFLISTNFNKANPKNALEFPCWRYSIAEGVLRGVKTEKDLTVDVFKSILDSTHVKGIFSTTLYSNIYDLKNGIIYLYHWHRFDEAVVLNVEEELAKGHYNVRIKDLFSERTVEGASREYIGLIILWSVGILLGITVVFVGIHYLKKRRLKASFAGNS